MRFLILSRFCTLAKPSLWQRLTPFRKQENPIDAQPDYSKIVDQILEASVENSDLRANIQQLLGEIKVTLEQAYTYPIVEEVLKQVKCQHLCNAAVEQFVGSISCPRNESIQIKFLQYAAINAKDAKERQMVEFYRIYLKKLQAVQSGNEAEFQQVNDELLSLAQQDCIMAKHLVAKEMYKVALNMMGSKNKRQRDLMLQESLRMFRECVDGEFPHSFYYIGEMSEKGDIPGGINLQFALECYTIAASFDNPSAFFKLAKMYKEGFLVQKDTNLEFIYTKKSAELGLKDAMHNLGVMYKEGKIVKQDELKALSWFTHAGNLGFPPSMYNAAMMFKNGTSDGFVLPNKKAALVWLEKVHRESDGQFDTTKEIKHIQMEMEQANAEC